MPGKSKQQNRVRLDAGDMDREALKRAVDSLKESGFEVDYTGGGKGKTSRMLPREFEVASQFDGRGLEPEEADRLREKAFSVDKHVDIVGNILNNVVSGKLADITFVEWIWGEWLQYASVPEEFRQRFSIGVGH